MAGIPVAGDLYHRLDGKLFEIKRQLRQPGWYPFDPRDLDVALQRVIEGMFGVAGADGFDPVTLNYDLPFGEMVQAGRFDWVSDLVNRRSFPIIGRGTEEVRLELFHCNSALSIRGARSKIAERGLICARIEHLLAFAAAYPDVQSRFPVIALDSISPEVDAWHVPLLGRDHQGRTLSTQTYLTDSDELCPGRFRFLAYQMPAVAKGWY